MVARRIDKASRLLDIAQGGTRNMAVLGPFLAKSPIDAQ
jgi:hypothetical protein